MEHIDQLVYQRENFDNSKLYEFLATNYDIRNLAQQICASKNAKINLLNLKKLGIASSA